MLLMAGATLMITGIITNMGIIMTTVMICRGIMITRMDTGTIIMNIQG
jgi:hypothetical protein